MKRFYDNLFDSVLALFILVAVIGSGILIVTSVIFTIQSGNSHAGIAAASAILAGLAMAVTYFYLRIISAKAIEDDE